MLGSEKTKEAKCNSGDSKNQNQPIESVPELEPSLEQNLHNVSNLLFYIIYYRKFNKHILGQCTK